MIERPRPGPPVGGVRTPATGNVAHETREREFGHDGVSGLLSDARALRAREVARPSAADRTAVEGIVADLLARVEGRR
jgi:hypothetical protein